MTRWQPDDDLSLKGGGWVRTWFSVDRPGLICIEVAGYVSANRMTRGETKRLIGRLKRMLDTSIPAATTASAARRKERA